MNSTNTILEIKIQQDFNRHEYKYIKRNLNRLGSHVSLNMKALEAIEAKTIRYLLKLKSLLDNADRSLSLSNVPPKVQAFLELTRIDLIIPVDGLQNINAQPTHLQRA